MWSTCACGVYACVYERVSGIRVIIAPVNSSFYEFSVKFLWMYAYAWFWGRL